MCIPSAWRPKADEVQTTNRDPVHSDTTSPVAQSYNINTGNFVQLCIIEVWDGMTGPPNIITLDPIMTPLVLDPVFASLFDVFLVKILQKEIPMTGSILLPNSR